MESCGKAAVVALLAVVVAVPAAEEPQEHPLVDLEVVCVGKVVVKDPSQDVDWANTNCHLFLLAVDSVGTKDHLENQEVRSAWKSPKCHPDLATVCRLPTLPTIAQKRRVLCP